jgi:hypothetical protein
MISKEMRPTTDGVYYRVLVHPLTIRPASTEPASLSQMVLIYIHAAYICLFICVYDGYNMSGPKRTVYWSIP